MALWTNLTEGLRVLLRKRETEQDMDEELRAYQEAAAEANRRSGMSDAAARRSARVEMGSMEAVKDEIRSAGWESAVEALFTDIRYSLRVLAKAPVFTSVVLLTLALGIGANTAIFSLIDSILLRSLPVRHPEELVQVTKSSFTNTLWEQVRDRQDVFSGVFSWSTDRFNLASGGMVQYADGLWVSGDFFRTLGLTPAAGRLLTLDDDRRGCAPRAVLSYGFWQAHYGGAESAIGTTVVLSGHPFEVIGVAPSGFFGMDVGRKFDVAAPLCATTAFDGQRSRLEARSWWWLNVVGRPKPGISGAQLKARLAALSPQVYEASLPGNWDPASQDNFRKRVLTPEPASTGLSRLRKQYEEPLHVLMGVVGLVLLIACANIASLLMARAAARGREMAMRQALGASRFRLMRQLITECVLLSCGGAALGLLVAHFGNQVLLHYISSVRSKVFLDFSLDGRVLGFTTGIAVLTGLLFGVGPAFRGTRASLTSTIKETHATNRGARGGFRLCVVASQVALSLVLLVTAGLLLRSFWNLAALDIGFDRRQVVLVNVNLLKADVSHSQAEATFQQLEDALRAQPGVVSVSRSWNTPLSNMEWNTNIHSDAPNSPAGDDALVWFNFVTPTYFETLRSPILAGRNFTTSDTATSPQVVVINQTLARKFFPGLNPVGRTLQAEGEARKLEPPVEVVGVVKDAKYESVREATFPTVFRPLTQMGEAAPNQNFELRTGLPQAVIAKPIERAVAGVDKDLPIEIHTLAAQVDDSMASERLLATLAGFFGGLALLLATIGLYGTLSYLVTQRSAEFGIRMALGAQPGAILRLVMRDVAYLLIGGIAAGAALALAATRVLGTLLFGLQPRDSATLAISSALLATVCIAASLLAARRATKLDPMSALRHD
ncbi:MAG TPA: ABC transporter permease [Candidatus Sulfopaludibacter sp.]|jgi:predicted permease|nr:ABC transporter permease [Candidatus Sulfopaludibacter sp.]